MSKRSLPPLVLREFQRDAVDHIASAMIDAVGKIRAAPTRRREITRRIGSFLLEAPTASGKTLIMAAAAERVSADAPVVWFWFAPFKGVIDQTMSALRAAAPGLRVRDPRADRTAIGNRAGDVFIATWAAVAARNVSTRKLRQDDDGALSLDSLVAQFRDAGMIIGVVVDEAHHTFNANTQAFTFFKEVLQPDLLMIASATPEDRDVELLRRMLEIERFQRVAVSRTRVVEARLNKKSVKAICFLAQGASQKLVDLNEVAIRKAVEQHRAVKATLKAAHVAMTPLLLVQAASSAWTPGRVRDFLVERMGFSAESVGIHTADEPDPDVQALAHDPQVEVLIFKMAVATGFDAPRANTLCALRPVVDAGFGLQVIGRIMRVHPALQARRDLPEILDTGYVFLGDADSQAGLKNAANQIGKIRNMIEVSTDRVEIYVASADGHGEIIVEDEHGQRMLVLTHEDYQPAGSNLGVRSRNDSEGINAGLERSSGDPKPLFEQLAEMRATRDGHGSRSNASVDQSGEAHVRRSEFNYPRRAGLKVPQRLRTEKMPRNAKILVDALISNITFTAEHLSMVRQQRTDIERRELDLFEVAAERRTTEKTEISDLFARQNAIQSLRVSEHIDPSDLARRLLGKLAAAIEQAGEDVPDQRILRKALNVILVRNPRLCKDALRKAIGSCADVVDAADLPETWESDDPLVTSPLNLYGCRPAGMNSWESAFADWLDRQDGTVSWWLRNVGRPTSENDWGVRIVLPDTGKGYYPDFVVCVNGRKKLDNIALAETKERIESSDSGAKSRSEHRDYGRALMLTYDATDARFIRVEYDPALGRNREIAVLRTDDLVND